MGTFFDGDGDRVTVMIKILEEIAASGGQATVTYSSLADQCAAELGLPFVNFSDPGERSAFSHLLGEVADESFQTRGLILTAIVVYESDKMIGAGMRESLIRNGLLKRNSDEDAYLMSLFSQMERIWSTYRAR